MWAKAEDCITSPHHAICCQANKSCNVAHAVHAMSEAAERVPSIAWVSIGGNDFLNAGCPDEFFFLQYLQKDVEKVVEHLQMLTPQTKIVLTGYCVPSGDLAWHPREACHKPQALLPVNLALKQAAEAKAVAFVNVSTIFGGSFARHSDPTYFQDDIHLNRRGYDRLWEYAPLRQALGCDGTSPDSPDSSLVSDATEVRAVWLLVMLAFMSGW
ncbi:unnamed protein product [Effrenium voratum]|nr:unnamed protein product [Effrenium voratum]